MKEVFWGRFLLTSIFWGMFLLISPATLAGADCAEYALVEHSAARAVSDVFSCKITLFRRGGLLSVDSQRRGSGTEGRNL